MAGSEPERLARPVLIELDDAAPPAPEAAPPVPEPGPPGPPAAPAAQRLALRGGPGRLFLWAAGGFVVLALTLWVTDFVAALLVRSPSLGALAAGLAGTSVLAAGAIVWGEWRAWRRIGVIEGLRERAAGAGDLAAAREAVAGVRALYRGRADMAWALARHAERADEALDPDAALALAEDVLMAPLDAEARRAVEVAVRQVAAATALVPLALVDVGVALVANVRMIRRIAAFYGGRAGTLGSWRLLRRVVAHLAATGAIAVSDDFVSSVAGGGIVATVSRRFGEGIVNGALTARVGIVAIEVCRPLPFRAAECPRVSALVRRALAGIVATGDRPRDGAAD